MRHNEARARRGFTLLEIMVAVAIVGVLSSLAAISYTLALRNGRSSGEVRRMVGRLQAARAQAISTGNCTGILIGGHTAAPFSDRVVMFQETTMAPAAPTPCPIYGPTDRIILNELQGSDEPSTGAQTIASHCTYDALDGLPGSVLQVVFHPDNGSPTVYLDGTPQVPGGVPVRYRMIFRDQLADPFASNGSRRQIEISPSGSAVVSANYP